MILSHKHKFIYIKTKKTAGTAIEAAISQLCGPDDVITPYREASEKDRQGLRPQNYRIEHPSKPQRSFWRRLLRRPERYWHPTIGFYEHMPAWRIRNYVGEDIWRSYYKFSFDRNPWDRQVSWYLYKTKSKAQPPSFERFMQSRNAYKALVQAGVDTPITVPKVNVTPNKDTSRDYHSYYTPELRDRVAEWYALEIELLDYDF